MSGYETVTETEQLCPSCMDFLDYVEQDSEYPPIPSFPLEYYRCRGCDRDWDEWIEEELL